MKGFKNVNVYVEGKGIVKTSIGFENGLISGTIFDIKKVNPNKLYDYEKTNYTSFDVNTHECYIVGR